MSGTDRFSGRSLADLAHLRQSIIDILTTPIGSRLMRRDYGSRLYELIDAPVSPSLLVEIYVAVAEALLRWEPRIILTRVQVEAIRPGHISLAIEGRYQKSAGPFRLDGLIV